MKPVLIVKTGTTVPEVAARRGDFEDWIRDGLGPPAGAVRVVSVYAGESLPKAATLAGIVVTGSSAMVSDREAWSERTGDWLAEAVDAGTPTLGICYGHQLLAQALGGAVGPNPQGREIGTARIDFLAPGDPLLGELGDAVPFQVSHVESVLELPAGATALASSDLDPHHAFAVGDRAWGIQFHPEFDADVMRGYVDARAEALRTEGLDPAAVRAAVAETPEGPRLLQRFARLLTR